MVLPMGEILEIVPRTPIFEDKETRKDVKKRVCLKCHKEFTSIGNFNRICERCKRRHDFVSTNCNDYVIKF